MWIHRRLLRPDEGGEGTGSEGAGADTASGSEDAGKADEAKADAGKGSSESWRSDWREALAGGDDATLKQLQRYASVTDIWTKAKSLERKVSSGELRAILPKNATPEQVTEWRKVNGVPEKPGDYDLGAASGKFGDDTKAFLDKALPILHKENLTNEQTKTTLKMFNDYILDQKTARAQSDLTFKEQGEDQLRDEWGNEYKRNIGLVHNLLDKSTDAKFKDEVLDARSGLTGKPLASDPRWLKMLLGMSLVDNPAGKLVPNGGANPMKGVDERIAEIEGKMGTKAYVNDDKMQAEYRELIDVREKLKARG